MNNKLFYSLAIALALTGCAKETLDARNMEISNNQIFERGSNQAFTGLVTNVPITKLPIEPIRLLLTKHSRYLNDKAIVGQVVNAAAGHILVCDVEVSAGKLDGDADCKIISTPSTNLQFAYKDNTLDGHLSVNYPKPNDPESSVEIISAEFEKGQLNGNTKMYSRAGQLVYDTDYQNGLPSKSENYLSHEGKVIMENFYDGKHVIHAKYYHPITGDFIGETHGRFNIGTANSLGNMSGVKASYNFNSDENGHVKIWLFRTHTFDKNRRNGPAVEYDENGNVVAEVIMKDNRPYSGKWRQHPNEKDSPILEYTNGADHLTLKTMKEQKQIECTHNKEKAYLESERTRLETELNASDDEEAQRQYKDAMSNLHVPAEMKEGFKQQCLNEG